MSSHGTSVQIIPGISIIVPIKVPNVSYLSGFAESYNRLLSSEHLQDLQIIIANDSSPEIYETVASWFSTSKVIHFRPSTDEKIGANDKVNSIFAAMEHVTSEEVLLLDDDFRPSVDSIRRFRAALRNYSCIKSMVTYIDPSFSDLINGCGIFILNLVHSERQFCGHLGFKLRDIREVGMPNPHGLFDELAFERQFKRAGKTIGFEPQIFLELVTHGTGKFLEQRVRYAYENMAYPFRFGLFLSVLPIIVLAMVLSNFYTALFFVLALTLIVLVITLIGQLSFGADKFPRYTWLFGPVWFWFYPFTTWVALVCYIRGGIWFGGRQVRRAI
jgi:hypothetical protein